MRVQLTKEYDGQPAGLIADWPDEKAQAAIAAGAAVATVRVRFLRDHSHRGRTFPARFEFDLLPVDAAKVVADGAAEKVGEGDEGAGGGGAGAGEAKADRPAEPAAPDAAAEKPARGRKVEGA